MLDGFNEGRLKSYFYLAATVMEVDELENALEVARVGSISFDIKEKARLLHSILDSTAAEKKYYLKLRKKYKYLSFISYHLICLYLLCNYFILSSAHLLCN
jgi:hypothetical protein